VRNSSACFYQQLFFDLQKKTPTGVSVFYSALSGDLMGRVRYVTSSLQQAIDRNIFVKCVPVDTTGRQFIVFQLFGRRVAKAGKPRKRYADYSLV